MGKTSKLAQKASYGSAATANEGGIYPKRQNRRRAKNTSQSTMFGDSGPSAAVISRPRVAVALSGGVDSSTVAALLVDLGFKVVGVHYTRWHPRRQDLEECPCKKDLEYVEKVASQLNIPLEVYNFRTLYKKQVFEPFLNGYRHGLTPNPDVLCNRHIKFGALLENVIGRKAEYLATGHYAIVSAKDRFLWDLPVEKTRIFNGLDRRKDQSYFLYNVRSEVLKYVTFPLGFLTKALVRKLAAYYNLPTASRKDSVGICFTGKLELSKFLKEALGEKPGPIIDLETNQKVGEHKGVWFYTIGQRKGLKIGGLDTPYYVAKLDAASNTVYVVKGRENPRLYRRQIILQDLNLFEPVKKGQEVYASVRYRQTPIPATVDAVSRQGISISAKDKGFWAPAPYQAGVLFSKAVFYQDLGFKDPSQVVKAFKDGSLRDKTESLLSSLAYVIGGGIIKNA